MVEVRYTPLVSEQVARGGENVVYWGERRVELKKVNWSRNPLSTPGVMAIHANYSAALGVVLWVRSLVTSA